MLSLNFKDCHTKIRHVDAHATLNDGVVVQVMGELSNNMQPVRRFMQTFVLAPEVCYIEWQSYYSAYTIRSGFEAFLFTVGI